MTTEAPHFTSDMSTENNITSSVTKMDLDDANASSLGTTTESYVDFEALNKAMVVSLLPTVVYIAVLMVLGLVGNTVVFIVYYKKFKPNATRTFVLVMSVCDLLANMISLPSEILDIRFNFTFDIPWLCRTVRSINSFLALSSAFILVAVARDRFNKICHPLDRHRSMNRIYIYVLVCCLASTALSIVFGVLNGSRAIPAGVGNVTGITCSVDDVYADTAFPLVYNLIMGVAFITCVVIMAVSYIRIALELRRHRKKFGDGSAGGGGWKPQGKDKDGKNSSVVEDTSSAQKHDKDSSEAKASASTEVVPQNVTNPKDSTRSIAVHSTLTDSFQVSDKDVLLLSVKSTDHEDKASSAEDSDEGCFSGSSVTETTFMSGEAVSEGQHQAGQDFPGTPSNEKDHHLSHDQSPGSSFQNEQKAGAGGAASLESPQSGSTPITDTTTSQDYIVSVSDSTNDDKAKETRDNPGVVNGSPDSDAHSQGIVQSPPHTHKSKAEGEKSSSLLRKLLTINSVRRNDVSEDPSSPARSRSPKKKSPKKRGTVRSISSSTTFMMFVLTAVFVVNYLPHLIIISARAVVDGLGEGLTGAVLNAYNIGLRSYFINCAVNSLVYGFCNARFRQECRQLFSRKK